jgi:hypothetical protein
MDVFVRDRKLSDVAWKVKDALRCLHQRVLWCLERRHLCEICYFLDLQYLSANSFHC